MTPRQPLLVWVRSGGATVVVDGSVWRVAAGWAAAVPAHTAVQIRTDPDAVVFPIHLAADGSPLSSVASFRVPQAWHDRLVFEFIHNPAR